MDAVGPTDRERVLVAERQLAERLAQTLLTRDQQIRRVPQLQRGGGVPDVVRGEPDVDEARIGPKLLLEAREERDHLVLHTLLDREDPRDVDPGLAADPAHPVRGDTTTPGVGLADRQLDPEPRLVLGLLAPYATHLRAGVAVDHVHTIEQNRKRWKRELGRPLWVAVAGPPGSGYQQASSWAGATHSRSAYAPVGDQPLSPWPRTSGTTKWKRSRKIRAGALYAWALEA